MRVLTSAEFEAVSGGDDGDCSSDGMGNMSGDCGVTSTGIADCATDSMGNTTMCTMDTVNVSHSPATGPGAADSLGFVSGVVAALAYATPPVGKAAIALIAIGFGAISAAQKRGNGLAP